MQDFIIQLIPEQCHKLVLHAYSNTGGLQLAKAVLQQQQRPQGQDPQGVG